MIARWIKENNHKDESQSGFGEDDAALVAPTFGLSINTLQYQLPPINTLVSTPNKATIALWDVGGQASLRSFWRTYYSPLVHCLIFVIDLSDVHRISEGVQWLYKMYKEVNDNNNGNMTATKVIILGNKVDLCMSTEVVSIEEKIREAFKGAHFMVCSAKTGKGVKECLDWIMRSV